MQEPEWGGSFSPWEEELGKDSWSGSSRLVFERHICFLGFERTETPGRRRGGPEHENLVGLRE